MKNNEKILMNKLYCDWANIPYTNKNLLGISFELYLIKLIMKKNKRGGKRKGAGRPKTKEDTKVMRIPNSKVDDVKKIIKK